MRFYYFEYELIYHTTLQFQNTSICPNFLRQVKGQTRRRPLSRLHTKQLSQQATTTATTTTTKSIRSSRSGSTTLNSGNTSLVAISIPFRLRNSIPGNAR
jgi:hypothetical protein